jgi:acetylornithine deacetylase
MARLMTPEELLARLVAFDSSSQVSNLPIADFICDYLDAPDVRIFRNPSANGAKVNVVIARGPRDKGAGGLTLSGHVDTVPFAEPDWTSDPLALTRRDDRLIGRGACDMKGFLALAIHRFASLNGSALRRPLVLLLTCDEELGTLGSRRFVETWSGDEPLPRAVVIGEPTSLSVIRLHKGHLKLRIIIQGRAGHSAYPASGLNAIELAGGVIDRLRELSRSLAAETSEEGALFGAVPHTTVNLATISGGVALNVIPERCVLEVGIRTMPGMTSSEVTDRVRRAVAGAVGGCGAVETIGDSPALRTAELAPVHLALARLMNQGDSRAVAFASDGGWLQTIGLDCVLWGPGSIEAAHRANEWLAVAEFERAAGLLERLVHQSCVAESSNP